MNVEGAEQLSTVMDLDEAAELMGKAPESVVEEYATHGGQ
jgi:hypothetical protein